MRASNISFKVFLLIFLASSIETNADSSACERKEKHLAVLDLAKESISKAKGFQPDCGIDSKDISSNSSECGANGKVSAHLDIANDLIDVAKNDYSVCAQVKSQREKRKYIPSNQTKELLLDKKPVDCYEILENGETNSGEYTIWPRSRNLDGRSIQVYCDMDTDGGGWTVIQRRGDFSNKVDFSRTWAEYKKGFGNMFEEFWIGNDNIFALTNQRSYAARFDMKNVAKEHRYATYSSFWIDDEYSGYRLHFGSYDGTAGDGIRQVNRMEFSTKDKQYEKSNISCPKDKLGGWWYNDCGLSNPNGKNQPGKSAGKRHFMNWHPFTVYDSLLMIEIKIRSKN